MNIKPIVSTFLVAVMLVAQGCKLFKKTEKETTEEYYEEIVLDENVIGENEIVAEPEYKPSAKRINDLLHTKLEISFNYEKQYVFGKATLTFKPYFYPTNTLVLDAQGFDIHAIRLNNKFGDTLAYTYDGKEIRIQLNKIYTRAQQYIVYVDYTAKPNNIRSDKEGQGHGHAITEDKGLYFINPTGEDSTKPIQIWTQGEVQSNSCWFPTIDEPNERTAQEIFVTVDPKYKTLSNGELVYSKYTNTGMRTDYWRQNLTHAPYLVMLAVGDFTIVKDKWKDIEVNYYVEKEYAPYAKQIFGNTPEMLEFYSNILGVSYPWDKYSQIVVRDYVSGAMENTGAVIHGEFMQQTSRELLDETHEDVIAHELFHHWFGDLVTCESWANLPLNESFATYGEYLWIDHKYGRMEADRHLHVNLRTYLMAAEYGEKNLIRYHYENPINMFDAHSYQKGGRVLHMLRNYVGDEAFFMALNQYLDKFKFKNAEIHDLRLIFEEITGEDLNWFFNQWFLGSGHPVLDIVHDYNAETGEYTLRVDQSGSSYFRLPIKVAIHVKGKETINEVEILPQEHNEFIFAVEAKPDWVSFDADKILICEKTEVKEDAQWIYQFNNSKLFLDKLEALNKLPDFAESRKETAKVIIYSALNDEFWGIRYKAIELMSEIGFLTAEENVNIMDKLKEIAIKDPKAKVREDAVLMLDKKEDPAYKNIFKTAVGDSSYSVMSAGIRAYAKVDEKAAVAIAEQFLKTGTMLDKTTVIGVLARYGKGNYLNQFDTLLTVTPAIKSISLLFDFSIYLKKASPIVRNRGVDILTKHYKANANGGFMGVIYSSVFRAIKVQTQEDIDAIDKQLQVAAVDTEISELTNTRNMLQEVLDKCNDLLMEE